MERNSVILEENRKRIIKFGVIERKNNTLQNLVPDQK